MWPMGTEQFGPETKSRTTDQGRNKSAQGKKEGRKKVLYQWLKKIKPPLMPIDALLVQ